MTDPMSPRPAGAADVETAARAVLRAVDAYRDAINGQGHPGEPHDRWGDCSLCGGAQYGTEDALYMAHGDLREALGEPRLTWEHR